MSYVILGNPENRRVLQFSQSLVAHGYSEPQVLSYRDVLEQGALDRIDLSGRILRIESPGENMEVRKLLIRKGMTAASETDPADMEDVASLHLPERMGEVIYLKDWYNGFVLLMQELRQCLDRYPGCRVMNRPEDITAMFDKRASQELLQGQGVPVPGFCTSLRHYEALIDHMEANKWSKVFIKPAHASSASGVIAFRKQGSKRQALTTIALRRDGDRIRLFNSLKLKTYSDEQEIGLMIDRILAENAIVESWLDKAVIGDRFFDLRILIVGGKARQRVLRTSRQVITNLHLGNKRGDLDEAERLFGAAKLEEACLAAERAASCFPASLYCGVDVLIGSKLEVNVLEVNAFGDLLPQVYHRGQSCYEAEIEAMAKKYQASIL